MVLQREKKESIIGERESTGKVLSVVSRDVRGWEKKWTSPKETRTRELGTGKQTGKKQISHVERVRKSSNNPDT